MGQFRVLAIGACIGVLLACTSQAAAHVPTGSGYPTYVAAGYSGAAMTVGRANVTMYRWSTSGWAHESRPPGRLGYVAPMGGGWSWFYETKRSTWYAVQTGNIAHWRCDAPSGGHAYTVRRSGELFGDQLTVPAPNVRAYVAPGAQARVLCDNPMYDASLTGTQLVAVTVDRGTACYTGGRCVTQGVEGYVAAGTLL